jgi:hypothetical protein
MRPEDGPELQPTRLISIADMAWPVQGPRDSLQPRTPLQHLEAYVSRELGKKLGRRRLALSPLDQLLLEDRTSKFIAKYVADPDVQKTLLKMWRRASPQLVNPLLPQGVVEVEVEEL